MADKSSDAAKLIFGDQTVDLPVYGGSVGPRAVDITSFYRDTGAFTYDPGFTSTASCESDITYIDGDEGVLLYRGYPIDQLAENGDFIETCYLVAQEAMSDNEIESKDYSASTNRTSCSMPQPTSMSL